ncbi:MAG: tRNA glutamyl-Q(34) synthetase GluQRS [Pseudomonadota bacterium]
MIRGRYAPSPTGPLHLGNLRTALLAWLQTRLMGGEFFLRIDDLDQPRVVTGATEQAVADLSWLGLDWDRGHQNSSDDTIAQSNRSIAYREAFTRLKSADHLYPCTCSRKDIAEAISAPHSENNAIYPGTCRNKRSIDSRKEYAWRFKTDGIHISFDDQLVGPVNQKLSDDVGDFVVQRKDGLFAYHLATVVDDHMMGVTDVVRGRDLLSSTPRQIALCKSLGLNTPRFWHVPLMLDESGNRMAKRILSESLAPLRQAGVRPESVVARLAESCGLTDSREPISCRELLEDLTIEEFKLRLTNSA